VSKRRKEALETSTEYVEGRERIGDREVEFRRYFDGQGGIAWTQYGPLSDDLNASHLCHSERTGRWWVSYDYRERITERQLSRRTTRSRNAKAVWQGYLLERAVEVCHVKLANNPAYRVAGNSSHWRRIIHMVRQALRDLDNGPFEQLMAAVSAVRWVEERPIDNKLVMRAIRKAARAHQSVPYRSEVLELLGDNVPISREKAAWNERLASIGFGWLPGGRPRKPKVKVSKIYA
jgi:hypothetical protein